MLRCTTFHALPPAPGTDNSKQGYPPTDIWLTTQSFVLSLRVP